MRHPIKHTQAVSQEAYMPVKNGKTVVSSWNEWDPLKHVIVGDASGTMVQAAEIAVQRDWQIGRAHV